MLLCVPFLFLLMVRKLKCELIDTLWNVNLVTMYYEDGKFVELIDTLWNVNPLTTTLTVPSFSELIDTLWNVKDRT